MKSRKNILKQAGVLLLFVVMILSTIAVKANTNQNSITVMNLGDGTTHHLSRKSYDYWDNNLTYGEGLIPCQYEPTYGELGTCADDFILDSTNEVMDVHWIGGFWNGNPAVFDWQITFYNDDGSGTRPGTVISGPVTYPNAECNEEFLEQSGTAYYYSWEVMLDEHVECTGGVKYWIAFQAQGVYPPQSGMAVHTNPQQLNECTFKSAYFGYPDWVPGSMVFGYISDLAFRLGGWCHDDTPPETTCNISGTNPVIVTLTATDDCTGVFYTNYKLDDDAWANYTEAIVVSEVGDHVIYYYSVDHVGNVEQEKNTIFTVEAPPITIEIRIQGGFGVSAIIKNTGTTNLTDVPYTIELDGKLIFVGKSKNDTIATLSAGEEVKVKDFVIGLGKTGIGVTVGGANANAEGTVFLFFVLGVT